MAENSKEGAYRQKSRSRRSTPRTQPEKRQEKYDHHQKNSLWLCPQLERESHIIHRGSFKVKSYLLLYKLSVRIFSWVMASIIPEIIVCILPFRTGQLTWHGGQIPENRLFVKIGDDHSQGSMKFKFPLANVLKPNSSKKTVVFAIFHAKDTRNNRRAVTSNYKKQLKDLLSTTWQ